MRLPCVSWAVLRLRKALISSAQAKCSLGQSMAKVFLNPLSIQIFISWYHLSKLLIFYKLNTIRNFAL
jgi:hypothetical protein